MAHQMPLRNFLFWSCLLFLFFAVGCARETGTPDLSATANATPFPLTPLPTATRNNGTPTPNPWVEPPYDTCHEDNRWSPNFTLFPMDNCDAEQCVDAGLETAAYGAWKAEMMQVHQITATEFGDRIQIANVSSMTSGARIMIIIDYVVINGWARTYQTDILGFTQEPDATQLAEVAQQAVFEEKQINLPQIIPMETLMETFATCDPDLEIDWCALDYPNFGGRLYATAFRVIDLDANECRDAAVYLDTGELWYCRERPCMIDE